MIFILLIAIVQPAWSQQNNSENIVSKYGPRRQIATIVYMGLGGAVLGLSTLSFYGRPQDKLSNIPLGFGVGVIIGTVYMTYQAAANPQEFYRAADLNYKPRWNNRDYGSDSSATDLFVQKQRPSFVQSWSF